MDGEVSHALAKYSDDSSLSKVMVSGLLKAGIDFNESILAAEGCISLTFERENSWAALKHLKGTLCHHQTSPESTEYHTVHSSCHKRAIAAVKVNLEQVSGQL